jgi:cell division inhibitor SulA
MTRVIKLQPEYRQNRYKHTHIVPKLTLSGKWLQEAGFEPENVVRVIVTDGKLTIVNC